MEIFTSLRDHLDALSADSGMTPANTSYAYHQPQSPLATPAYGLSHSAISALLRGFSLPSLPEGWMLPALCMLAIATSYLLGVVSGQNLSVLSARSRHHNGHSQTDAKDSTEDEHHSAAHEDSSQLHSNSHGGNPIHKLKNMLGGALGALHGHGKHSGPIRSDSAGQHSTPTLSAVLPNVASGGSGSRQHGRSSASQLQSVPESPPSNHPSLADTHASGDAASSGRRARLAVLSHPVHEWYINESDLRFFKARVEGGVEGDEEGMLDAPQWEKTLEKHVPNVMQYNSCRRILQDGQTEYLSVTVCADATVIETMDFLLDDDARRNWEEFLIENDVLEQGDFSKRQQVVRWRRKFPFNFLTDREYVIARQLFGGAADAPRGIRAGGKQAAPPIDPTADLYGITKSIRHPGADQSGKLVQVERYYSMWRCRAVPCPWNSGRPTCEVTLLHSEDLRVPERLARFAVSRGALAYVMAMAKGLENFVQARRERVGPNEQDTYAYGARHPGGHLNQSLSRSLQHTNGRGGISFPPVPGVPLGRPASGSAHSSGAAATAAAAAAAVAKGPHGGSSSMHAANGLVEDSAHASLTTTHEPNSPATSYNGTPAGGSVMGDLQNHAGLQGLVASSSNHNPAAAVGAAVVGAASHLGGALQDAANFLNPISSGPRNLPPGPPRPVIWRGSKSVKRVLYSGRRPVDRVQRLGVLIIGTSLAWLLRGKVQARRQKRRDDELLALE